MILFVDIQEKPWCCAIKNDSHKEVLSSASPTRQNFSRPEHVRTSKNVATGSAHKLKVDENRWDVSGRKPRNAR
jgi:hypothetical protein